MHRRCCWPPESAAAGVVQPVAHLVPQARPPRGTRSTSVVRSLDVVMPESFRPERTLSRMVIAGNGLGFWNTMPMRRRVSVARWSSAVDVAAVEEHRARERCAPGTSSCMRLRMRRNVDLPQPDGPMSAVTLRGRISRDTRSSTLWSPNQALTSSASRPAGSRIVDGALLGRQCRLPCLPASPRCSGETASSRPSDRAGLRCAGRGRRARGR